MIQVMHHGLIQILQPSTTVINNNSIKWHQKSVNLVIAKLWHVSPVYLATWMHFSWTGIKINIIFYWHLYCQTCRVCRLGLLNWTNWISSKVYDTECLYMYWQTVGSSIKTTEHQTVRPKCCSTCIVQLNWCIMMCNSTCFIKTTHK